MPGNSSRNIRMRRDCEGPLDHFGGHLAADRAGVLCNSDFGTPSHSAFVAI